MYPIPGSSLSNWASSSIAWLPFRLCLYSILLHSSAYFSNHCRAFCLPLPFTPAGNNSLNDNPNVSSVGLAAKNSHSPRITPPRSSRRLKALNSKGRGSSMKMEYFSTSFKSFFNCLQFIFFNFRQVGSFFRFARIGD